MTIRVLSETITELELAPNWSITLGKPVEGQQGVAITNVGRTTPSDWGVIVPEPDTPRQEQFANNAATVSTVVFDSNALAKHCLYISKVASLGTVTHNVGGFVNLNAIGSLTPQDISYLACRILSAEMISGISLLFVEGQSTGSVLELDYGRETLMRFDQHARKIIVAEGIRLISARIREWVSTEDPDWQETVIDYEVEAKPQIALAVWDRLSDELRNFQHIWPRQLASGDRPLLSVTVRWK